MKIILSGGGTLGPVTPLLALVNVCRKKGLAADFIWVGTKNGPEKELVEKAGLPFRVISAGKWRRYFSFWNVTDFFKLIISFFWSLWFLKKEKPDLLISAGGFVSVPLHWAGRFLGVPAWIHQQDVRPGLANKLMAKGAKKITVAVKESAVYFKKEVEWLGNPTRDLSVSDRSAAKARFGITDAEPVIFALGGGTGSNRINRMILEALNSWPPEWHVIHLTGKERPSEACEHAAKLFKNYRSYKFFSEEMKDAYAAADVVVGRAGFGTITELAALGKPAILMPMSGTHQEENVDYLAKRGAVLVLDERVDSGASLAATVKDLVGDEKKRLELGENLRRLLPPAKEERMIEIIEMMRKM